mmetsp:Transcript_12207/g.17374  ORF Transcript_12207/g.17374 Transcript_12207/m.17374 type:complete len:89 (+) Transcript_12207:3807-4073(+)
MVDSVKDFVWDFIPKHGRKYNDHAHSKYHVARDHNLTCEFVTKTLIAAFAYHSKKGKEDYSCQENDDSPGIPQMDMNTRAPIEWNEPI